MYTLYSTKRRKKKRSKKKTTLCVKSEWIMAGPRLIAETRTMKRKKQNYKSQLSIKLLIAGCSFTCWTQPFNHLGKIEFDVLAVFYVFFLLFQKHFLLVEDVLCVWFSSVASFLLFSLFFFSSFGLMRVPFNGMDEGKRCKL